MEHARAGKLGRMSRRPHLLGIDDGPFDKSDAEVTLVAVTMEGADLVEAVATSEFPVDGEDATGHLARWIGGLRSAAALHGVLFGGVTIAGLAVIDLPELARRLRLPAIVVNRREPRDDALERALVAAGLEERIAILRRMPAAWRHSDGLWVAHAGGEAAEVAALVEECRSKSRLPEPLRLAHLIAGAIARGSSRGRP
jgi:endonuclease V-like protein UPF0215 family